jgi:hypothetical protein
MTWINNDQRATWCKQNPVCMEIVGDALRSTEKEETKLVTKWLQQPDK